MLDLTRARPLIDACSHRELRDALAAYDRAVHDRTALLSIPADHHHRQAEEAHRAELLAAALESRQPRSERAAVAQADEADQAHAERLDAATRAEQQRKAKLYAVATSPEASMAILVEIARARAAIFAQHNDPGSQPGEPLDELARVYTSRAFAYPDLAYVPGEVIGTALGRLQRRQWWPLVLGGWSAVYQLDHHMARHQWNEAAWSWVAAEEFDFLGPSAIRFRQTWRCTTGARFLHHDEVTGPGFQPANVHRIGPGGVRLDTHDAVVAGSLIWIGTGPSGERGVEHDDLGGLKPVTFG